MDTDGHGFKKGLMTDYFKLLNESRRPWLDTDALKQKFIAQSAKVHPDRIHSADEAEKSAKAKEFAELNAAYNCLAEPKTRLLHLIELERGAKPADIQQIPAGLADLFAEVAMTCRQVDAFLAGKNKATSPLLQVQFFERGQVWTETLQNLQYKLTKLREALADKLKSLDAQWPDTTKRAEILASLEELYRVFSYFNRWNSQITERIVQLSF